MRSWLLGASASGDDVFVISRAQLSAVDRNETNDLYDARVEGVAQSPAAACVLAGNARGAVDGTGG